MARSGGSGNFLYIVWHAEKSVSRYVVERESEVRCDPKKGANGNGALLGAVRVIDEVQRFMNLVTGQKVS
jgi:hypothetical protein